MNKTTKTFNQRLLASLVLAMVMLLSAQAAWAVNYNMYIAGVRVTSDNATSLSSIDGVEGTVMYSASLNTLVLQNASITHKTLNKGDLTDCGLLAAIDGLTISVSGNCTIDCTQGCGMVLGGSHVTVTLTGSGTLTVKGTSAIQMETTTTRLTVDGPTLVADAKSSLGYGVCGATPSGTTYNGILRVNSGKVMATGGSSACSIGNLKTFALGDGMEIAKPVGAKFYEHAVTTAAGVPVTSTVTIAPVPDMHEVPLTLESIEDGTITIKNNRMLTLGYAIDGGDIIWKNTTPIEISVVAGQQVAFYSDNATLNNSQGNQTAISCSADCYVFGNIMSLISSTGFKDLKELTAPYCFQHLFDSNVHIKNHAFKKLLLPATTLTYNCYSSMFYGCDGLTSAPDLPAMTLADGCYTNMFRSCDGLTSAPALPATTLKSDCYMNMFYSCGSLATAPALPATTLESNCYNGMFFGCISLTTAPDLPANTLVYWCYTQMFYGCKKLNSVKCLATDISASNCTSNWLTGVSATGTFEKAAGFTGWSTGVSGIPEGWDVTEDTSKQPCGLAFSVDALNVTYGDEYTLPTLTNPDGLTVTYTSSKPSVATVGSDGTLTILTAGTTVITASFEGDDIHYPGNASYTLTVTSKGDSPELAFDREGMVVTKGKAVTAPKLTIPDGLTATYSTSNNKVASVNATTGALTINGVGTATITATTPATLQYTTASAVYYIMVVSNAEKIRCDANNDGNVSITDAVTVVNYILGE